MVDVLMVGESVGNTIPLEQRRPAILPAFFNS
jgi:hypothetical protein